MIRTLGVIGSFALAAVAGADTIVDGEYLLRNHPAADYAPPGYGLKLQSLYQVKGKNTFTFDFEHDQSRVIMTVSGNVIRIQGVAFGGRDIGNTYANDKYRGVYTLNFVYDKGVMKVPNDDDLWVKAKKNANRGTIRTPLGDAIGLYDEHGRSLFSFRLGDENHDRGHRGFDGICGWGWLSGGKRAPCGEWLFTAQLIPAPGPIALGLLGTACLARRRRR